MFKKITSKTLIIIFVVLLAIVAINKLMKSKKGDRTFRSELVAININEVTGISLYPRAEKHQEIRFARSAGSWQVENDKMKTNADTSAVKNLLVTLENLKPKRLAATDKSKWEEYQVNDSLGTRVKIIENGVTTLELIIGKFTFKQQGRITTSYVRLAEEDNIYAVDGILGITFNQGFNNWRDKTVIKGNSDDWTQLTYQYPADSGFVLTKQGNKWMLNGILADSVKTATYLNALVNLNNSNFIDDFEPEGIQPRYSLTITGNNTPVPISVNAFAADSVHQYILTSSLNPDVAFDGAQSKLVEKIFVSRGSLADTTATY